MATNETVMPAIKSDLKVGMSYEKGLVINAARATADFINNSW
jgi:hypothetical protein